MSLFDLVFQAPRSPAAPGAIHDARRTRHRRSGRSTCMTRSRTPIALASLLGALLAIGCVTPPVHPWVARDGLVQIETYNRGQLFVKRDHQLGRYDSLMIEGVGFRWSPGEARLGDAEEDRIIAMLIGAVEGTQDGPVGITDAPGPCVLAVNFFLKDLELHTPNRLADSRSGFVSSYGAATMVLELRDSMNDEPLARFVQRRDLGGGPEIPTRGASLIRLSQAIGRALYDMGNQLIKVIPPTSSGHSKPECRGGMAKVALGRH